MMDQPAKDPAREKALSELKRQIAEQRARIDPRVLKIAQEAAEQAQDEKERLQDVSPKEQRTLAPPKAVPPHMVPYDREAAAEAISLFLRNCDDRETFEKRLLMLLRSREN